MELRSIHLRVNAPWLVCGDFNAICSVAERIGGTNVSRADILPMQNFLHDSNMHDMKATGSFFTWTNKHEYHGGYANFLPEGLFDRCPCVIHFEEKLIHRNIPCKYFNMWSMAPDFDQIVKSGWSGTVKGTSMFQVVTKLKMLKKDLKKLNRDQFSDVENLTHVTELSLKYFQTLLSTDPLNEDRIIAEKECS
ncbi:uncharacterized protein LOC141614254 [Silene latifolia]|uniref:uncharacterized protein LOC141614254 n=1 Tax=Silene latifolia TaxID=37657 RepID=UPI003D76D6CD